MTSLRSPALHLTTMARRVHPVLLACFVVMLTALAPEFARAEPSGDDSFARDIRPILETHCTYCHGLPDEFPEGDFALVGFDSRDVAVRSPRTWKKVLNAIEGYEMPPRDEEQLSDEDRTKLIGWIEGVLAEPEFGDVPSPGRPVLRRLTRLEYNNTVRDLLGLETDVFMFSERLPFDKSYFDPAAGKMPERLQIRGREYGARYPVLLPDAGLPSDSRAEHGFTNRGDAQSLSAAQLEQYVELAEQIAFHPELLSRAERMQEMFPDARFREASSEEQPGRQTQQIVNTVKRLAPNNNVARTAEGSAFTLQEFAQRLQTAFEEDRGGVYDVSENANSTIAGKGGVLHLAFGENASRVFGVNPSEDIWNAAFATAEEASGDSLFTNKKKSQKAFFFGFQRSGEQPWSGLGEIGLVLLSRRGQSGTVRVSVEFEGEQSQSIAVDLKEGAGTDNTFVSFAAPHGKTIKRLAIDGRGFSGDYVLLDDLAFITRDKPSSDSAVVGRELPPEEPQARQRGNRLQIDRRLAKQPPSDRLARFMKRAFRRPVAPTEVELYLGLYESSRASGGTDETAMRRALHGVLSSPNFLYRVENGRSGSEAESVVPLSDHELAARLSYFLWSSMPDDELLRLADEGRLQDAVVLEEQTRRMLSDPRVRELSENFFVEWLRLRELWSAQPDSRQFREFYEGPKGKRTLAADMFCEALLYFETLLVENRSVLELVHSDYTYVNSRLAKLYGAESMVGEDSGWQRIQLADARRGGVLTMGATLTLTSFPHRTSPIRRGAWFLETIYNRPPPPPKIAVADIDEQEGLDADLTLREKVERHRANSACAVCHDRIDPPGFALENFNAIGGWREKDGSETIDPSGSLRGSGSFDGPADFKSRVLQERDQFMNGFTEHLLSYALARELDYYDTRPVKEIVEAAAEDEYRLSRLIVEVVKSYPFRNVQRANEP